MARVYGGEKTLLDPLMNPVERLLFRFSGINASKEMNWKQQMVAMLIINMVWFLLGMFVLMNQAWLPLNPDGNSNMSPDLAFNTSISFVVNCNLQHYSGESGLISRSVVPDVPAVCKAATGMAAAVILFVALKEKRPQLATFTTLVKSITSIAAHISVVAILFC
jgi:K+-transporting ATPase ATPase A chain